MVTEDTTAQLSYDPENEGAWDGQLPHADLVDQLPPPTERKPGGPLDRDEWRRSNAARVGHAAYKLLDVLSGYSNADGQCWPGMDLLADDTGMSTRALRYALAELRRKQIVWTTYPGSTVCKANPYQLAGGLDGWDCAGSCTTIVQEVAQQIVPEVAHRTPSSSNPKKNPRDPGLVDAKRVDDPGPEPGITTGVKPSSFEEEGVTGAGVTVKDAQAWVDSHLSEIPLPFEIEQVGKHCWPAWAKHWDLDLAGAIVVWTKNIASRQKFRKDVVMHLGKVGLPKPRQADPEQERARQRTSEQLDRRLAEAPPRAVKCAGCGFPRQLQPGETRCYSCRQEGVPDGVGTGWGSGYTDRPETARDASATLRLLQNSARDKAKVYELQQTLGDCVSEVAAQTHAPIGRGRHQHWQRIHDPGRYPVLSDKDLVDLCFPTSQNQRRISRDLLPRAIRTLQSLEEAKELQIRGGKGRWQVLPPTPRTRAELE